MEGGILVCIELQPYWRDKPLFEDIRGEIFALEKLQGFTVRQVLLPDSILRPILTEICLGMWSPFSPVLDGRAVNIADKEEIVIEYYVKDVPACPIMRVKKSVAPNRSQ